MAEPVAPMELQPEQADTVVTSPVKPKRKQPSTSTPTSGAGTGIGKKRVTSRSSARESRAARSANVEMVETSAAVDEVDEEAVQARDRYLADMRAAAIVAKHQPEAGCSLCRTTHVVATCSGPCKRSVCSQCYAITQYASCVRCSKNWCSDCDPGTLRGGKFTCEGCADKCAACKHRLERNSEGTIETSACKVCDARVCPTCAWLCPRCNTLLCKDAVGAHKHRVHVTCQRCRAPSPQMCTVCSSRGGCAKCSDNNVHPWFCRKCSNEHSNPCVEHYVEKPIPRLVYF